MSNLKAMRKTLSTLRRLGRLEAVDEALVTMALGLAEAVDGAPDNAALWREYRAVEQRLRSVGLADGQPGEDILASLYSEVRNPAN